MTRVKMDTILKVNNEIDDFVVNAVREFGESESGEYYCEGEIIVNAEKIYRALDKEYGKDLLEITTFDDPLRVWACPNCLKTEYIIKGGNYCGFCGQKIKQRK